MTKETEQAFAILYCEYKRRRSYGTSKQEAVFFEDAKLEKIDAFSKWNPNDISYAVLELEQAGFVKMDILGDVTLLESGLSFMENKPKDFFQSLFSGVVELISLLAYI